METLNWTLDVSQMDLKGSQIDMKSPVRIYKRLCKFLQFRSNLLVNFVANKSFLQPRDNNKNILTQADRRLTVEFDEKVITSKNLNAD